MKEIKQMAKKNEKVKNNKATKNKIKNEIKKNISKNNKKESKDKVKTQYKGYIWAICPQCHTDYMFLDSNGLYNDTIPEDILCPECIRINNNIKRIQEYILKNEIKNRSIIKLMKHIMLYDKNSNKRKIDTVFKEAQKIYKMQKEQKVLTK